MRNNTVDFNVHHGISTVAVAALKGTFAVAIFFCVEFAKPNSVSTQSINQDFLF